MVSKTYAQYCIEIYNNWWTIDSPPPPSTDYQGNANVYFNLQMTG